MSDKLAMFGGTPIVRSENRWLEWPIVTDADRKAVLRVLDSGKFTVGAKNEQEIHGLEQDWAEFCGTRYMVAVTSGTVALELASRSAEAVGGGMLAVDLIERATGEILSTEVNHTMAFHGLAAVADIDIGEAVVDHIEEVLSQ